MKRIEFIKQVEERRLLPVYLFLGEERLFQEELLKRALNSLLTPEDQQFNVVRLNAADLEPEVLVTNLETPPFFGPCRVIYLAELEKGSSRLEEAVLKGLGCLANGVYLQSDD